jgi:hypothetical protein
VNLTNCFPHKLAAICCDTPAEQIDDAVWIQLRAGRWVMNHQTVIGCHYNCGVKSKEIAMGDKTGADCQRDESQIEITDEMRASIIEVLRKSEQRSERRRKAPRKPRKIARSLGEVVVAARLRVRDRLRKLNEFVNRDDLTDEAMSLYRERRELIRDLLVALGNNERDYNDALARQLLEKLGRKKKQINELKKDRRVFKKKPPLNNNTSSGA